MFSFDKHHQTSSRSVGTNLLPTSNVWAFRFVPHRYSCFFIYFILTICRGVQQCLIVVLICSSLMTNKIEQLLLSYWPFEYAHFGKMPVPVFCLLKKWEACLSLLEFWEFLMCSRRKSFMDYRQRKCFPLWIAFHFFNNFLLKKEVLTVTFSVFLLWLAHFVHCLENPCLTQDLEIILLFFLGAL